MRITATALALSLAVTGCATRPAKIGVGHANIHAYQQYTCQALYTERDNRQADCSQFESLQKSVHQTDLATFWAGMVIIWPLAFVPLATPDYEQDILECRGKIQAIDTQLVLKECP